MDCICLIQKPHSLLSLEEGGGENQISSPNRQKKQQQTTKGPVKKPTGDRKGHPKCKKRINFHEQNRTGNKAQNV